MTDLRGPVGSLRAPENQDLALLASRIAAAMPPLSEDEQRLAIELYRQLAEGEPVAPQRLAPQIGVSARPVDETLESWPGSTATSAAA